MYRIRTFTADMADEAAALLDARAERSAAIRALLDDPGATGCAAFSRGDGPGRLLGFLIGTCSSDPFRGKHAWIHEAGLAVAGSEDTGMVIDMYAALAATWVDEGFRDHYIRVPARERWLVDTLFDLEFGKQQVHGILRVTADGAAHRGAEADGMVIRHAVRDDSTALRELADIISDYQTGSPVFASVPQSFREQISDGYPSLLDEPGCLLWVAEAEDTLVGVHAYLPYTADTYDLSLPDSGMELKVAAVRPEYRNRGASSALFAAGLDEVRHGGHLWCVADWRSSNPLASRFWHRCGFVDASYRLVRRV